jgi:2-dehydropantoate 2-reductase
MNEKVLVVGSGALATLFAARLSSAGINVTMLGNWLEGLAALRNGGARLDGEGSFKVQATENLEECKGAKFALVLVKSWQTERAAYKLLDCLPEDGLAVTLQNGLGNDANLSNILGMQRVSRGVTTLGVTLLEPGRARLSGEGLVILEQHPRIGLVENILRIATFEVKVVENAWPVVWGKLVVNAAINPLTALLRIKNGELLTIHPASELMGDLARETASVAQALGVELPFSDPERAVREVAQFTSENYSSMLQDVLRGAPTEVDAINGAIIRKGEEYKIPTPVNRVIWSLVKALPSHGKI